MTKALNKLKVNEEVEASVQLGNEFHYLVALSGTGSGTGSLRS
jgi:hypothetical protein